MNGAHLHLLVNHIPIFTIAFGAAALAWSVYRGSDEMRWAAVGLFILAGVSAWAADLSGEAAEDLVKNLADVTKALIHEHEEAADFAKASATLLALGSIGMVFIGRYKVKFYRTAQIALLVFAIFSSTIQARTAYLGGLIRHTEIRADHEN